MTTHPLCVPRSNNPIYRENFYEAEIYDPCEACEERAKLVFRLRKTGNLAPIHGLAIVEMLNNLEVLEVIAGMNDGS